MLFTNDHFNIDVNSNKEFPVKRKLLDGIEFVVNATQCNVCFVEFSIRNIFSTRKSLGLWTAARLPIDVFTTYIHRRPHSVMQFGQWGGRVPIP